MRSHATEYLKKYLVLGVNGHSMLHGELLMPSETVQKLYDKDSDE